MEGRKEKEGKPDWTLLPFAPIEEVVEVLTMGANKYSRDNWLNVSQLDYEAAAFRHLSKHMQGVENDKESGHSHLAHAICNLLFVAELERLTNISHDDIIKEREKWPVEEIMRRCQESRSTKS